MPPPRSKPLSERVIIISDHRTLESGCSLKKTDNSWIARGRERETDFFPKCQTATAISFRFYDIYDLLQYAGGGGGSYYVWDQDDWQEIFRLRDV
jgi:hypothetical protein